jgi:GTP:adenosylcobinamide-phosphate guanylyltransferase
MSLLSHDTLWNAITTEVLLNINTLKDLEIAEKVMREQKKN